MVCETAVISDASDLIEPSYECLEAQVEYVLRMMVMILTNSDVWKNIDLRKFKALV
jgi:hypothetical protein